MGMADKARTFRKRFRLDSHHAIERFGVFFGAFALFGVMVIGSSAVSALQSNNNELLNTALYTTVFTTSKTELKGDVDGVFTNKQGDKALVMMHFPATAAISSDAADYQVFLLGSDTDLTSETVKTPGITGSFHVFGSTGYVGVLLDADQPFDKQVLNLTVRANAELSYIEDKQRQSGTDEVPDDASFHKYDQWRVFVNPGATATTAIPALDTARFDPARAYYDVVVKAEEQETRGKLDQKLLAMRAGLTRIQSYTADLDTTKVDGLFLRPPAVPAVIARDTITGVSTAEASNGVSTLALKTDHVVPGGVDLNWRAGNVYDGYLNALVPIGQNHAEFLAKKHREGSDATSQQISDMQWILSNDTNLKSDYQSSDVTLRPLTNVMNNLSQAYQDYTKDKSVYQSELVLDLLRLDAKLRDVQSNSSLRADRGVLTTLY